MSYVDGLEADRRAKLDRVRELGKDPYGERAAWAGSILPIWGAIGKIESYDRSLAIGDLQYTEEMLKSWTLRGRVTSKNNRGKLKFFFIQDRTGEIQLMFSRADFDDYSWDLVSQIDVLDHLQVSGDLCRTKTGEATMKVKTMTFMGKSIALPPEKFHGVKDEELLVRQRYLALVQDKSLRDNLLLRSRVLSSLRRGLDREGFTEVETPVLSAHASGAVARPFQTHHNALDEDFCLRIAPELDLKRLLVGGLEQVYEIGKVFRNEGVDATHNPEFTILECYQAYADHEDMMSLCEFLVKQAFSLAIKPLDIKVFDRRPFCDLVAEYAGVDDVWNEGEVAFRYGKVAGASEGVKPKDPSHWEMVEFLFDHAVLPRLTEPTFVTFYPAAMCPLARRHGPDRRLAERFELFVNGMEVANGYSELNDPDEQYANFVSQAEEKARAAWDQETGKTKDAKPEDYPDEWGNMRQFYAEEIDRDYVHALKVGMPMAGGLGIGVDRLMMLVTGTSTIRDVIAFPLVKRKKG